MSDAGGFQEPARRKLDPMPYVRKIRYQRKGLGSLQSVADTIQQIEGWFPGSSSYRNNNPGNLRYPTPILGATGVDSSGFLIFPDYATGRAAEEHQITLDASRGLSIQEFIAKYAPASDQNNPAGYAASLAAGEGLSVTDPLSAALEPSSSPSVVPLADVGDSTDLSLAYLGLGLIAAGLVASSL